ncbi:hypothetical protein Asp14428_30280 [Actinoplanes sp. NBRC 14428]|nr:hypothetical protein Asp14428_30280 [Actinoplanes sp. NBRC 14428]
MVVRHAPITSILRVAAARRRRGNTVEQGSHLVPLSFRLTDDWESVAPMRLTRRTAVRQVRRARSCNERREHQGTERHRKSGSRQGAQRATVRGKVRGIGTTWRVKCGTRTVRATVRKSAIGIRTWT